MKKIAVCLLVLAMAGMVSAVTLPTGCTGLWTFDNTSNLGQATIGTDLTFVGTKTYQVGPGGYAIVDPLGTKTTNYIVCTPGIAGNGGSTKGMANEWTIAMDVLVPTIGSWTALFQTNPDNKNDADCFINKTGKIGQGDPGYTTSSVSANTWYRIVVSVDCGTSFKIFVDGTKCLDKTITSSNTTLQIDQRWSLESKAVIFGDDSGEDAAIVCNTLAFFDHAMTDSEAASMGNAYTTLAIPEPTTVGIMLIGAMFMSRRKK
jgi:hypothetical protein